MLKEFKYRLYISLVGVLSLLVIGDGTISALNTCERSETEIEIEEENAELIDIVQSTFSNIGINLGGSNDYACQYAIRTTDNSIFETISPLFSETPIICPQKDDVPFYILYKTLKVDFV